MKLEPIASWLQQQGVAVQGQDLFINFIPQGMSGILLRDDFGGTRIDHELPGFYKGSFMVIARHADYATSKGLAKSAVATLQLLANTTVDGVSFRYLRPRALPFVYAPSPGQMVESSVTVDACFVDADA